jgi:hypothetical protein
MRKLKCSIAGVVVLFLTGCWALSVHPLYSEENLVFDKMLVGQWYEPDCRDQVWIFESAGEKTYRLTIVQEGVAEQLQNVDDDDFRMILKTNPATDGVFEARLVQLGEDTFLDLYPEYPAGGNEMYKSHIIPAHSFSRISIQGHVLVLSLFDTEWLRENIDDGNITVKHERRDDLIVLTASTEELQKFIMEHIDEAFEEPAELRRL